MSNHDDTQQRRPRRNVPVRVELRTERPTKVIHGETREGEGVKFPFSVLDRFLEVAGWKHGDTRTDVKLLVDLIPATGMDCDEYPWIVVAPEMIREVYLPRWHEYMSESGRAQIECTLDEIILRAAKLPGPLKAQIDIVTTEHIGSRADKRREWDEKTQQIREVVYEERLQQIARDLPGAVGLMFDRILEELIAGLPGIDLDGYFPDSEEPELLGEELELAAEEVAEEVAERAIAEAISEVEGALPERTEAELAQELVVPPVAVLGGTGKPESKRGKARTTAASKAAKTRRCDEFEEESR